MWTNDTVTADMKIGKQILINVYVKKERIKTNIPISSATSDTKWQNSIFNVTSYDTKSREINQIITSWIIC
jgi:predicted RNA-binding protein with PIN domain